MEKLSKKQIEVLAILCEGVAYLDHRDGSLSLEDGDGNSYYIRKDTFEILKKLETIEAGRFMNEHMERWLITDKGSQYVLDHAPEKINHLLS